MHRLSRLALGLSAFVALGVVAPIARAQTAVHLPNDVQLRLAGSTTVGQKLTQELATAWARKLGLTSVRVNAGLDPDEYEITAERSESSRRLRVEVKAKGTGSGVEALLRGQADFWMASRQARDSDLDAARRRNASNAPSITQFTALGTEHIIALDALALVVNGRNPVKRLTIAQMRDVYTGRVNNWSQIGGPNLPLAVYALDQNFGDNDILCGQVVGVSDTVKCLDGMPKLAAPRFTVGEEMPEAVAGNPGGIGYVSLGNRRSARPMQIGTECNTGIDADTFRVKSDEYPLARRLYLYSHPTRPLSSAARGYLDFVLSAEGQAAVAKAGFADLSPGLASEGYGADRLDSARDAQDGGRLRIRPTDVRAFEEATGGADRLSITFRFQSGTNSLDNRAEVDIGRLAAMLQQPANARMQVVLIGYSGATGDYAENRTLSRERAEAVRDRLVTGFGIKDVASIGVGPAAAVACNLDPAMGPLNQRVEVWLRKKSGT